MKTTLYSNHSCKIIPIPCSTKLRTGVTLAEAAERRQIQALPRLKQSTASIYGGILRAHILPAFGTFPVSELTGPRIEAFLTDKAQILAPRTVGNISTVLHAILEHAQASGWFTGLPAWVTPSGKGGKTTEVLTAREKKRLVEHLINNISANTHVDESFGLLLCLYTGMRLGEICALQWGISRKREPSASAVPSSASATPTARAAQWLSSIPPRVKAPTESFLCPYFFGSWWKACAKEKPASS